MRDLDAGDLARRLTLADLVLRPVGVGWLRPGLLALAVLGLVLPSLARRPWFWLALALLAAGASSRPGRSPTTTPICSAYWCLAVAIASLDADPRPALAWSGRVLIGLVFALRRAREDALARLPRWPLLPRDALVSDPRLASFAQIAGGLSTDELDARARGCSSARRRRARVEAIDACRPEPARFGAPSGSRPSARSRGEALHRARVPVAARRADRRACAIRC